MTPPVLRFLFSWLLDPSAAEPAAAAGLGPVGFGAHASACVSAPFGVGEAEYVAEKEPIRDTGGGEGPFADSASRSGGGPTFRAFWMALAMRRLPPATVGRPAEAAACFLPTALAWVAASATREPGTATPPPGPASGRASGDGAGRFLPAEASAIGGAFGGANGSACGGACGGACEDACGSSGA